MKYLIIIIIVTLSKFSYSQQFYNRTLGTTTPNDPFLSSSRAFYMPRSLDTTLNGGLDSIGALMYDRIRAKLAVRDTVLSGGHKFTFLFKQDDTATTLATQYDLTQLPQTTLSNIGTGYRWVATSDGQIKTVSSSNTILWDSTSTANSLTAKVDTSVIATQYDLTQIGGASALTYKNVGYGGIGNTLSLGESAFQYDSITNELRVDSVNLLNARINEDNYNADSIPFFGTSITVGTGQSTGNRYSTLTANKLNSIEANYGISGATLLTQGVANIWRIPVFSRAKYRWLILEWGVNDINSVADSTTFDTEYRKYIDTAIIARGWPAARVVILAPSYISPALFPTATLAKQAQFRGATQSIATAKGTKWVDIYSAQVFRNPDYIISTDGIHPNDYGAYVYVNSIYKTVSDSVMSMDQNISVNGYTELQRLKLRNSDTADYKSVAIGQDSSGNVVRFSKDQIIQNSETLPTPQGASIDLIGRGYFGNVSSPTTPEVVQVNGMAKDTSLRATGSAPSGLTGSGIELFMVGSVGGIIAYNRTSVSGLTLALNQLGGQVVVNATAASGGAEQFFVNGGAKASFGQFVSTLPGGLTGNGVEIGRISATLGYVGAFNRDASSADNLSLNGLGGNVLVGTFTDNTVGKIQVNGKITVATHTIASNADSAVIWDRSTNEYKVARINGIAPTTLYTGDGTLAGDRTVNTGGFTTTWTGSLTGDNFSVVNTNVTNGNAISGTANGSGIGVSGTSNSNFGVFGTSTSSTGVRGGSTSGAGIEATTTSGAHALFAQAAPSSTNTTQRILQLTRLTTGTAADGIAASIDFAIERDDNSSSTSNQLISKWSTAAAATRTSQFELYGVNSAVSARKLAVAGSGQLTLDAYGSETFTGAPVKLLAETSTGTIIEVGGRNLQSGTTYTVLSTDVYKIIGLSNTAARTITLPAATTFPSGVTVWFKDEAGTAGTGNITINRAGSDTIDGATSYTINSNYGFIGLYSDGSAAWFVR